MIPYDILILVLAMVIDQLWGEPPAAIHPVVWMGKGVSILERASPKGRVSQLTFGGMMVFVIAGASGALVYYSMEMLKGISTLAYVLAGAYLLKTTFAVRELKDAALRVERALTSGQVNNARRFLGHLVSRNTRELDERLIVAATVESLAENTTDSFIAPLVFFLLFGVPGAIVYRAVNTLDAMVGYRGRYEYLGKAAAKLDDVLNFVPSRLAAALTVMASFIAGENAAAAFRIMIRDHRLTESPNAGWTMSAMSGALGVQLEKLGHYRLGDPVTELLPWKIRSAINIMYVVVMLALVASLLAKVVIYASTS